jgi:hypothetical protein
MADSKTVRPGQFQKGVDPRRHMNGSKSRAAVKFNHDLRELLILEGERQHTDATSQVKLKKVQWLIKVIWNKALQGESWAVQFIAERTEGKVTQPIDASHDVTYRVIYDPPKPEEKDAK